MEQLPLDSNQCRTRISKISPYDCRTTSPANGEAGDAESRKRYSLTDEQLEELGLTLMRLEEKMEELKHHFWLRK